ncbi:MAG: helix-turn-helix domain-containing protein [Clostridiaceae bacterium]
MNVFGNRLRSLIEEAEIEGKDFAKAIHVQPSTVSNWLGGVRFPKDDVLIKIADYFKVSIDYLLGRTDNPKSSEPAIAEPIETIAANHNGEWTPEELEELERYKQFLRSKRDKK